MESNQLQCSLTALASVTGQLQPWVHLHPKCYCPDKARYQDHPIYCWRSETEPVVGNQVPYRLEYECGHFEVGVIHSSPEYVVRWANGSISR